MLNGCRRCLALISLLLAPGLEGLADALGEEARPNVLFIAIDDLRTSLGCYGDAIAKTPHIDALARRGLRFDRAYCNQAVCGPSRASLLTGRLPDHIRVWHNRHRFRDALPDSVTLPELFKHNGYHTQSIGKVFSGRASEDDPQSWSVPSSQSLSDWRNYVLPENQGGGKQAATERVDVPDDAYRDGKMAAFACETLTRLKQQQQPFFLAIGFSKPHLPFCAPEKYWKQYDENVFSRNIGRRPKGAPELAWSEQMELGGYKAIPNDEQVSKQQTIHLRHGYYACVSYVDAQVGKLLRTLRQLELEQNTIVVLWGDHGFSLGEASHWCKKTNFEMDTRVPLIMSGKGIANGAGTEAMIELVDLYPTLAELAGLQAPGKLDGRSFVSVLRDPTKSFRKIVLSQHSRPFKSGPPRVMGYSIRSNTHRYTHWIQWPSRTVSAEELYDYRANTSVRADRPYLVEKENLIGDPGAAEQLAKLRKTLQSVLVERGLIARVSDAATFEASGK